MTRQVSFSRGDAEDIIERRHVEGDRDREALANLATLVTLAAAVDREPPAGEAVAVAMFRARLQAPAERVKPTWRVVATRLFTTKTLALLLVGGVATGGVAYAGSTGRLPGSVTHSVATTTSDAPPGGAAASVGGSASASVKPSGSSPAASPPLVAGSPAPAGADTSLAGLCDAYESGTGSSNGNAADSPRFRSLIAAAGGAGNVDAYCASLGVTAKSKQDADSAAASTQVPAPSKPHGPPSTPPGQAKTHQNSPGPTRPGNGNTNGNGNGSGKSNGKSNGNQNATEKSKGKGNGSGNG